ncbi:MAG: protein kinase [Pirellulales bacterium]
MDGQQSNDAGSSTNHLALVLADVVRRRGGGETLTDEAVLAEHPSLGELLRSALSRLNRGRSDDSQATLPRYAEAPQHSYSENPSDSRATIDHTPASGKRLDEATDFSTEFPSIATSDASRFCKVRLHAFGGIGEVWVAVDHQLSREVALKVLQNRHQGDDSKHQRFLIEGQVTGILEHPGIVPVYSLGIDAEAQPFYAMRFVRGESLRAAFRQFREKRIPGRRIERHDLEFRSLVQRVIDVCYTIAYAHSRGVLHRDLKPENIMLGKYGETYVVDWGMARTLGGQIADSSMPTEGLVRTDRPTFYSETQYGSALGTPGFMSPEQAQGQTDELSGATDIYSLGCILYYLLAGQAPISSDGFTDFLNRVTMGDFLSPELIDSTAPRGLSAICMKALAVRPVDRYSSANELAAELERWLADEPLAALPDTRLQHVARFARRHYRWLAPLVLGLSLVTAITIAAAVLINRARFNAEAAARSEEVAKDRAEHNFLKARETVDQWLTGYTEALANYPGVQQFRKRMLEQAAVQYEQFVQEESTDGSLQLEQGRTYLRLGDIRRRLLDPAAALVSYRRASELFERLPADQLAKQGLAESWGRLALVQAELGDNEAALASHRQAVTLATGLTGAQTADAAEAAELLATLEINLANHLAILSQFSESEDAFSDSIRQLRHLIRLKPARPELHDALATALLGTGQVALKQGKAIEARRSIGKAVEVLTAAPAMAGETHKRLELLALGNLLLASVEGRLGNYVTEATGYHQALDAYTTLAQELPDVPRYAEEAARIRIDLGQTLLKLGRTSEAQEALKLSLQSLEEFSKRYQNVPRFTEARGLATDLAAQVEYVAGRDAAAIVLFRAAIALFQTLVKEFPDVPEYRSRLAVAEMHLATALLSQGQHEDAQEHFEMAKSLLGQRGKESKPGPFEVYAAAMLHARWGESLWLSDKKGDSKPHFVAATELWKTLGESTADAEYLAAAARYFSTCPDLEFRDGQRAQSLVELALTQSPESPLLQVILARIALESGNADECVRLLDAVQLDKGFPALEAEKQLLLAIAHRQLGQEEKARVNYDLAVTQLQTIGAGDWELRALHREYEKQSATADEKQ